MKHLIEPGFEDHERPAVAALYWQAFGAKLAVPMGPKAKALTFLENALDPAFALVARDANGAVAGVAGFKTSDGAMVGGGLRDLAAVYGWLSTLWRAPILALVERDLAQDVLLMDGICVAATARGQGLGTALLTAIKEEARQRGCATVRLDVIDTNPRARALYERQGFEQIASENLGPLRWIFGFRSSAKMLYRL